MLEHERYHVCNLDPLKVVLVRALSAALFFLPALDSLHASVSSFGGTAAVYQATGTGLATATLLGSLACTAPFVVAGLMAYSLIAMRARRPLRFGVLWGRKAPRLNRRQQLWTAANGPSCALDKSGLRRQLARYRQAGRGAHMVDCTRRSLVVDLDRRVDTMLIEETIATERECCPFFDVAWEPDIRRLTISVSEAARTSTRCHRIRPRSRNTRSRRRTGLSPCSQLLGPPRLPSWWRCTRSRAATPDSFSRSPAAACSQASTGSSPAPGPLAWSRQFGLLWHLLRHRASVNQ